MEIFGITFSSVDIFLFSVCGALVLILIRLAYKSEIRRRDIFNKAAKELTDSFHRELKEVYPIPANWPDNIDQYLRARFDTLSEAVGKFKRHLSNRKQKRISEAWFSFYCCTGREVDRNCQCYHHYKPFSGVSIIDGKEVHFDNSKTYKANLKKTVDAILTFAKQK
jgi:hypothetical protein